MGRIARNYRMDQTLLDALLETHGTWEDAAAALELDIEASSSDEERAPLLGALGLVQWRHLGRPDVARTHLETSVDLDITLVPVIDGLAELLAEAKEWEALTSLLLDAIDASEAPSDQVRWFGRLVTTCAVSQNDPDKALVVLAGALRRHPGDAHLLDIATTHLASTPVRAELIDQLTLHLGAAAEAGGEAQAAPVHRALGLLLAQDDENLDRAVVHLEQAAATLSNDPRLHDELVRALTALEEWEPLVAILARRLTDEQDAEARLALLDSLEALHAARRGDLNAAAALRWQRIEEGEDDDASWDLLIDYRTKLEDWDGVVATLRTRLDQAVDAEARTSLRRRLARVVEERHSDRAAAAQLWRAVLDADASDEEAEERVLAWAETEGDRTTSRALLTARIERTDAPAQRCELLLRRATHEDADGAADEALGTLAEAWTLQPTNEEALARYTVGLARAESWKTLEEVWRAVGDDPTREPTVRASAWTKAGTIAEEQLESHSAAREAFEASLALDPQQPALLHSIARLAQAYGDQEGAADALRRLATISEGDDQVAALRAQADLHRDAGGSEWEAALLAVLAVAPHHLATLHELADAQAARGAWLECHETLHRVLDQVHEPAARADVLFRVGEIELVHLERAEAAIATLEESTTLAPGHDGASSLLVDLWVGREAWERALPLLDQLLAHDVERDESVARILALYLARATDALHLYDRALAAWMRVVSLTPDHLDARRAIPRLLALLERPSEAIDAARSVLDSEGALLDEAIQCELFEVIARASEALGRDEEAARAWAALQQLDPWHAEALRRLTHLGGTESHARRVEATQRLLSLTDDPRERFRLFVELGDLQTDEDPAAAIIAFRDAIEIDPDSRAVLAKLLNLFTQTEQWRRAAEILGRLHTLETSPERRTRLLLTLAALFRDEIGEVHEAARFFEMVLDAEPSRTEVFDELQSMLAGAQEWDLLEKSYRRMIGRTDETAIAVRYSLLLAVGRVYERHLFRLDEAVAAYQAAAALQPNEVEPRIRLAGIIPAEGKSDEQVIAEHRAILALVPDRTASYHALFTAHERRREFDAAWRLSAALRVLGQADGREKQFFDQLRSPTLVLARRPIGREDWPLLQHASMDYLLTTLFESLGTSALGAFASAPSDVGLTDDDLLDLDADHPITNLVRYVSQVLGVTGLQCYYLERGKGVASANFPVPSLLIGADIAGAQPGRREVFRLTRAMLGLRHEFRLATIAGSKENLKGWVYGALAAWTNQIIPDPSEAVVRTIATKIHALPPAALERIGIAVNGIFASQSELDVGRWLRGVEYTMNRIALLLTGDLERAIEALREETSPLGDLTEAERIRDLIVYSMTDAYGEVRGRLHLAVGQS